MSEPQNANQQSDRNLTHFENNDEVTAQPDKIDKSRVTFQDDVEMRDGKHEVDIEANKPQEERGESAAEQLFGNANRIRDNTKRAMISMCTPLDKIGEFGVGFALYFEYIKACGVLLVFLFGIFGIHSTLFNRDGDVCESNKDESDPCRGGFVINYSMGNRGPGDSFRLSGILNLIFVLVALMAAFFYRQVQTMTSKEIDKMMVTASDYTVMVHGIPKEETAAEIEAFFEDAFSGKDNNTSPTIKKVAKVNMVYKIGRIISLGRKKQKLEAKTNRSKKENEKLDSINIELELYKDRLEKGCSKTEKNDDIDSPNTTKEKKKESRFDKINLTSNINRYVALMKRKRYFDQNKMLSKRNYRQVELEDQIRYCESKIYNPLTKFTGIAFVTFNREEDAQSIIKRFQMGFIYSLIFSVFNHIVWFFGYQDTNKLYKRRIIRVRRAHEPDDVFWENLGIGWRKIIRKRLVNFIASFLLIVVCCGLVLGLNYLQSFCVKFAKSKAVTTFLSILCSFCVVIINSFFGFFIRKLARYQKPTTHTSYYINIAENLSIAQFINTAFVTLFVEYVQKDKIRLWVAGISSTPLILNWKDGMIPSVFFVFILNAAVPSLAKFVDIWWIIRMIKRILFEFGVKFGKTEAEALFKDPPFDVAQQYANIQKTMLFTAFYASLLPVGVLISLGGLIITYWTDKYIFLRRTSTPNCLGKPLAEEMADYLELIVVAFTAGNLVFEKLASDNVSSLNIAAFVIAAVVLILPNGTLADWFFSEKESGSQDASQIYEKDLELWHFTEYHKVNPATHQYTECDIEGGETGRSLNTLPENGVYTETPSKQPNLNSLEHQANRKKNTEIDNLLMYAQKNPKFKDRQELSSNASRNHLQTRNNLQSRNQLQSKNHFESTNQGRSAQFLNHAISSQAAATVKSENKPRVVRMLKVLFINNNRFTRAARQRKFPQITPMVTDSVSSSMAMQPEYESPMESPTQISPSLRNNIEGKNQQTVVPKSKFAGIKLTPIQRPSTRAVEAVDRLVAMKAQVNKLKIESDDKTDEQCN